MSKSAEQITKKIVIFQKICVAAKNNKVEELKELVETHKIDVNFPFGKGVTILHFACQSQSMESVFYLLSKGADLEKRDNYEPPRTPRSLLSVESTKRLAQYIEETQKFNKKPSPKGDQKTGQEKKLVKELSSVNVSLATREGTLEFQEDGSIYSGTKYEVTVNAPPKSKFCVRMTQHGFPEAGDLQLGVYIEGSQNVVPILKVHKTHGHDFFLNKIDTKDHTSLFANLMVFRTPVGYQGLPKNIFGRARLIQLECEDSWTWENTKCAERSHSPVRRP